MADSDSSEESDLAFFFRRHAESDGEVSKLKATASSSSHPAVNDPVDGNLLLSDGVVLTPISLPGAPHPITLVEEKSKGIGFQLWPAAEFLCRYLASDAAQPFLPGGSLASCHVLELGAGVGLVGIWAVAAGCSSSTVTDLVEVLPILRANVDANPTLAPKLSVRPCAWGTDDWRAWSPKSDTPSWSNSENSTTATPHASVDKAAGAVTADSLLEVAQNDRDDSEPAPNLVLIADCVYWPELFAPLVETLRGLCAPRASGGCGCEVLMAHTRRWKKDGKFFALASKYLEVTKLHEVVTSSSSTPGPSAFEMSEEAGQIPSNVDEIKVTDSQVSSEGPTAEACSCESDEVTPPLGASNARTVMRVYRIRAKVQPPPAP